MPMAVTLPCTPISRVATPRSGHHAITCGPTERTVRRLLVGACARGPLGLWWRCCTPRDGATAARHVSAAHGLQWLSGAGTASRTQHGAVGFDHWSIVLSKPSSSTVGNACGVSRFAAIKHDTAVRQPHTCAGTGASRHCEPAREGSGATTHGTYPSELSESTLESVP